jgi:hypothetical protein
MVRAEIKGCLVLSIASVDYDTSRDAKPVSHIDSQLEIMQAEWC